MKIRRGLGKAEGVGEFARSVFVHSDSSFRGCALNRSRARVISDTRVKSVAKSGVSKGCLKLRLAVPQINDQHERLIKWIARLFRIIRETIAQGRRDLELRLFR